MELHAAGALAALSRLGGDVRDAAEESARFGATLIARDARRLAPKRTGRSSISVSG